MPLQWYVKDLGHSAKSASDWLHLNTHTPLTQRNRIGLTTLSRHRVGTYQENKFTRNPLRNARPQSSQLAMPLWTDPGLECGIGVHDKNQVKIKKTRKKKGTSKSSDLDLLVKYLPPPQSGLVCEEKATTVCDSLLYECAYGGLSVSFVLQGSEICVLVRF